MFEQQRHEMGAGGTCFCPKCDDRSPHKRGVPCQYGRGPQRGAKRLRERSQHDQFLQQKRQG